MCRLCPVPEWSEPIKVTVADLPAYFAKQISWNFERLNFGNGAVIDTASGRAERPTITGKVGCKLKDGMRPLCNRSNIDRYLLVSECLFCPGRRYGCTPRANCTGKRRHCYAQCKVSIYGDDPLVSEIYFSGSHGTGNITDVNKHRVPAAVRNQLKRKRMEGASPDEALMWFKKYVEEQGLNSEDPRILPNGNQVRHMLKRIKPAIGPTMATTHNTVSSPAPTITSKSDPDLNLPQIDHTKQENNTPEIPWSNVTMNDGTGDLSDEDSIPNSSSTSTGTSSNTVHVTFTPLNSPLNTPFAMPTQQFAAVNMSNMGDVSRTSGSQPTCTTILLTPTSIRTSSGTDSKRMPTAFTTSSHGLSKRQANLQLEGKTQEVTILKHHIRILEQENLNKISHIAELETQLHAMKERDISRLESQVQRLETENLKKDVKILQLEKQIQAFLQQKNLSTPAEGNDSEVTIPNLQQIHIEQRSIDNGTSQSSDS